MGRVRVTVRVMVMVKVMVRVKVIVRVTVIGLWVWLRVMVYGRGGVINYYCQYWYRWWDW